MPRLGRWCVKTGDRDLRPVVLSAEMDVVGRLCQQVNEIAV